MGASVISGCDTSPAFEPAEHDLDLISSSESRSLAIPRPLLFHRETQNPQSRYQEAKTLWRSYKR